MKLKYKLLSSTAVAPKRATIGSAGFDLSADIEQDIEINPGECKLITTGIAIALENENCAALIYPRSGLSSKHGITLANNVGVIDSDYRGEIKIPLVNRSNASFTITPGMRIAQMIITPIFLPEMTEVENLPESQRGSSGFGSTGTK